MDSGKLEAGTVLGLSTFKVNQLIRIPLASRALLPSLTNQYIWLMKGTTVDIATGYPDYFAIVSTSIKQSGQQLMMWHFTKSQISSQRRPAVKLEQLHTNNEAR